MVVTAVITALFFYVRPFRSGGEVGGWGGTQRGAYGKLARVTSNDKLMGNEWK